MCRSKTHLAFVAVLVLSACGTSPTEPAARRASSRTALDRATMPIPPCNVGLVGVPYIYNGDQIGWKCVAPPVACPAHTVYHEQDLLGMKMTWCYPDEGFGKPEPTPTVIPTLTATPNVSGSILKAPVSR